MHSESIIQHRHSKEKGANEARLALHLGQRHLRWPPPVQHHRGAKKNPVNADALTSFGTASLQYVSRETDDRHVFFFPRRLKKSPQSVHSKVKTVTTHAHTSPLGLSHHEPSVSVVTFHLVCCRTPAIPAVTLQHVQQGRRHRTGSSTSEHRSPTHAPCLLCAPSHQGTVMGSSSKADVVLSAKHRNYGNPPRWEKRRVAPKQERQWVRQQLHLGRSVITDGEKTRLRRRVSHRLELARSASDHVRVCASLCVETLQIRRMRLQQPTSVHSATLTAEEHLRLLMQQCQLANEMFIAARFLAFQQNLGKSEADFGLCHQFALRHTFRMLEGLVIPCVGLCCAVSCRNTQHVRRDFFSKER